MKKLIKGILVIFLMAGLIGCTQQENKEPEKNEEAVQEEVKVESEEQSENTESEDSEMQDTDSHSSAVKEMYVYFVNSEGSIEKKTIETSDLNEDMLWEQLQINGIVPGDSKVLSMKIDESSQMELDVDEKFGEQLRNLGTNGEEEVIKCVVNSFLDSFSCDGVRITEEGNVLVSGHKEYSDYINRME